MKKNEGTTNRTISLPATKRYIAPDIVIVEIEIEQNILASGSGDLPGMPGGPW